MTDHEKEILDKIKHSTEEVQIPESLEPDQILKMLEEHDSGTNKGHSFTDTVPAEDAPDSEAHDPKIHNQNTSGHSAKKHGFSHNRRMRGGLVAAALVLVVGIGAYIRHQNLSSDATVSALGGQSSGNHSSSDKLDSSEMLQAATDYDEIYAYLKSYQDELNASGNTGYMTEDGIALYSGSASTGARSTASESASVASDSASTPARAVDNSFSDTNVRTKGVGEADIVKTDGNYLYTLKANSQEISIVDIQSDQMKVVSTISLNENFQASEFYLNDQKLFVLGNLQNTQVDSDSKTLYRGSCTRIQTYDLTDITSPKSIGTVDQSGSYRTSRFKDGYLYVFSDYYIYDTITKKDYPSYVPLVGNSILKQSDIYLPTNHAADQYLVVSSISADDPDQAKDQKAVMSENGEVYVSENNIYIYEYTNSSILADNLAAKNQTIIRKLSYDKGKLSGSAQGKVKGYLNDSFSIDEYDDTLRLVTTVTHNAVNASQSNAVYVLDTDLKTIGKIEDLAKDEQVYSARFFGDTGYFVTYEQTDPLFSVDFSDPKNPKILGSLKIPGFSEYLHFYGNDLLLGIGMDTDENGITNGVKVSMFDISDPSDVKEVSTYTLDQYYYSDVFYDYRAALVDPEKNLIGFPLSGSQGQYVILSYDKDQGFQVQMLEEVNGTSYLGTRGVYANEKFYVINGNAIEAYRMGDYVKVDDLLL